MITASDIVIAGVMPITYHRLIATSETGRRRIDIMLRYCIIANKVRHSTEIHSSAGQRLLH